MTTTSHCTATSALDAAAELFLLGGAGGLAGGAELFLLSGFAAEENNAVLVWAGGVGLAG